MATSSRAAILALGAVLLLAGCAVLPTPTPSGGGPSATPTDNATGTPEPTPTDESDAPNTPLSIACTSLVSDQVIYDWGSGNWALDPSFAPPKGSSAATIVGYGGTACGWVNLTSQEKLYVAAAHVTADQQSVLEAHLDATGAPVSNFGAIGYFGVSNGTGQADAFTNTVWISASSTWFLEAGDAQPLMNAAVSAAG